MNAFGGFETFREVIVNLREEGNRLAGPLFWSCGGAD
jgi:hypothetical protein